MNQPPPTLLCAAIVAPMDGPVIQEGAVLMANGRIGAVGPSGRLRDQYPAALIEDYPDSILMPGLVNAHVHLELSDLRRLPSPSSFVAWILDLMSQSASSGGPTAQTVGHAVTRGVAQCIRFGVTTAGDISRQCRLTRPVLRESVLRVVSYGEIQAMAQRRELLEERFAGAADMTHQTPRLTIGLTPHAPYTVEPAGFRRCLDFARRRHCPLATHLAENPQEAEFLADHSGPYRYLWETGINAWDEKVPKYTGGPIRFARDIGLLDHPTLLAHVNYCDDDELAILAGGKASVVYCPRTHAYFGHPPHRWRDMIARGINLAIGTDSCASSPDLNLLDDLRLVHRLAPEVEAMTLWHMATINAAAALELEREIGSLTPGKSADLVAFKIEGHDPLATLLEDNILPQQVWIEGRSVSS